MLEAALRPHLPLSLKDELLADIERLRLPELEPPRGLAGPRPAPGQALILAFPAYRPPGLIAVDHAAGPSVGAAARWIRLAIMDADQARSQLQEERTRLDGIRQGFIDDGLTVETEDESLGEVALNQHQADIGTETFERERDISILEQVEAELADVEHALKRLDDGSYGRCEACGKPIGDERLGAMPAARFCLDDQAGAERDARSALDRP